MTIRWHPPLDRLFGSATPLTLAGPARVAELLDELAAREPRFARYLRSAGGATRSDALLVWRRGENLGLADWVEPDDEVEILVLVTGG